MNKPISKTEDQEIADNRAEIATALLLASGISAEVFGDRSAAFDIFDRMEYDENGDLAPQGELTQDLRQCLELAGKLGLSATDHTVAFAIYDRVFGQTLGEKLTDVIDLYEASLKPPTRRR